MEIRLMTKEEEELVLNNYRLVYYLVSKLGFSENDYDDMVSIGTIGLIKAAKTFNKDAKIKFSTYASKCINNEIFMYHRKAKHHNNYAYLEDVIATDGDGNKITIADIIPSQEIHFTELMEENETFARVVSIILNVLSTKERFVMLCRMADVEQAVIAEIIGFAQSYISRIESRCNRKIKKYFNGEKQFKEVYSMEFKDNTYEITFSSKDVANFDNIFAAFLEKVNIKDLPNFRINSNKQRIIIQTPAYPEVFSFFAKIIKEIDDYDLKYTANQNALSEKNDDYNKVEESNESEVANESIEEESNESEVENEPIKTQQDNKSSTKVGVKELKAHMLSKESVFTVKELKKDFPELDASTINNTLMYAKSRGQIIPVSRGAYKVNKNENTN